MKRTILSLWNGDISPMDEPSFHTEDADDLRSFINRDVKRLGEVLDENGKKIFEEIQNQYEELIEIHSRDAFEKGFSLGTRLTGEAFTK